MQTQEQLSESAHRVLSDVDSLLNDLNAVFAATGGKSADLAGAIDEATRLQAGLRIALGLQMADATFTADYVLEVLAAVLSDVQASVQQHGGVLSDFVRETIWAQLAMRLLPESEQPHHE